MNEKTKKIAFYCQVVLECLLLISCISLALDLFNVWQNVFITENFDVVSRNYGKLVLAIELTITILIFINLILYAIQFMLKDKQKSIVNKINNILSILSVFILVVLFVIAYTGLNKIYRYDTTIFSLSDTDYAISIALQVSILKILLLMVGVSICYYIMGRKEISKRCRNLRIGALACLVLCVIFGVVFGYTTVLGNDKEFSGEYYSISDISQSFIDYGGRRVIAYSLSIRYAGEITSLSDYRYEIRDGSETRTEEFSRSYFPEITIKNIDDYSIKVYKQDAEILEFKPNIFNTQAIVFMVLTILSLGGTITLYYLSKNKKNEETSNTKEVEQTINE